MCEPYPTFVKASPEIPDIALTTTDVEKLNLPTPKPAYSPTDPKTGLNDFLSQNGRKIKHMTGDGNCMFRSLSYHIFGHQEEHLATRKLIIEFESLNRQQFAKYLLEVNEPDIELHLKKMGKPFVWGTHIELKAAASYFQIPLYFCQKSPKTNCYEWHCFSPICSAEKLNYPQNRVYPTRSLGHFELAYYTGVHYDCIVSTDTNSTPKVPPQLTGQISFCAEVLE